MQEKCHLGPSVPQWQGLWSDHLCSLHLNRLSSHTDLSDQTYTHLFSRLTSCPGPWTQVLIFQPSLQSHPLLLGELECPLSSARAGVLGKCRPPYLHHCPHHHLQLLLCLIPTLPRKTSSSALPEQPGPLTHAPLVCSSLPSVSPVFLTLRRRPLKCDSALQPWPWKCSRCRHSLSVLETALLTQAWGWDGWMASPMPWTWTWVNFGRWWGTGRPGLLQSMGLQRVGHDWVTEQQRPKQRLPGMCCVFPVRIRFTSRWEARGFRAYCSPSYTCQLPAALGTLSITLLSPILIPSHSWQAKASLWIVSAELRIKGREIIHLTCSA